MRKIIAVSEFVPAIVFATLAALILSRLAIGAFPADPTAWSVFLFLAPLFRELAMFVPADPMTAVFAIVGLLAASGAVVALTGRTEWLRARFVMFHAAFLAVLVGMHDERVFSAATADTPVSHAWPMPDLQNLDPFAGMALVLTLIACLGVHRDMIKGLARGKSVA